jgi:TerC family integral membrane protein
MINRNNRAMKYRTRMISSSSNEGLLLIMITLSSIILLHQAVMVQSYVALPGTTRISHHQYRGHNSNNGKISGSLHKGPWTAFTTKTQTSTNLQNNHLLNMVTTGTGRAKARQSTSTKVQMLLPSQNQHYSTNSQYNSLRRTSTSLQATEETKATTTTSSPQGPTILIDPNTDTSPSVTDSAEIYSRAINRTLQWVAAAGLFGLSLWAGTGNIDTAAEFFAGYLVEQSLSIDNLFVFLLLFDYFQVPLSSQDRVLNYGIYGAVIMRAVMIGLGSVALSRFHEILLVFAGILVYSSASALTEFLSDEEEEEDEDLGENSIVKFSRNLFDATDKFDGDRFFSIEDGIKKVTPLFICMVAVEISDVVFAVDSIPAVFGVTENPLIVFSSNMFAIMGLRSLYTILSKAAQDLEYLEPAVAIVLGFIGSKMVAEYFGFMISTEFSLAVVVTCLATGVGLSTLQKSKEATAE